MNFRRKFLEMGSWRTCALGVCKLRKCAERKFVRTSARTVAKLRSNFRLAEPLVPFYGCCRLHCCLLINLPVRFSYDRKQCAIEIHVLEYFKGSVVEVNCLKRERKMPDPPVFVFTYSRIPQRLFACRGGDPMCCIKIAVLGKDQVWFSTGASLPRLFQV